MSQSFSQTTAAHAALLAQQQDRVRAWKMGSDDDDDDEVRRSARITSGCATTADHVRRR